MAAGYGPDGRDYPQNTVSAIAHSAGFPGCTRVFLSQDPRAFGQPQDSGQSGIYIVSARDPANLEILSFADVPAGHTTTCINDCKYLWTGGPMKDKDQPADWAGRPVFVTDIRNPKKPQVYKNPVDLGRNDGVTDYAHDVQVDEAGIAWVSGRGGLRGYWTKGRHWDPVARAHRVATASDPIPYAGGKFIQQPDVGFPGGSFAHNALRPTRSLGGHEAGDLALVTIENFSTSCETDGNLLIVSLGDSRDGQGWRSTPENPYRLDIVGEFSPWGQEGTNPRTGCSAHYFEMKGDLVVQSFYGNGTRLIDVSDPAHPEQVGYYRPDGGSGSSKWVDLRSHRPSHLIGLALVAVSLPGCADAARQSPPEAPSSSQAGSAVSENPSVATTDVADDAAPQTATDRTRGSRGGDDKQAATRSTACGSTVDSAGGESTKYCGPGQALIEAREGTSTILGAECIRRGDFVIAHFGTNYRELDQAATDYVGLVVGGVTEESAGAPSHFAAEVIVGKKRWALSDAEPVVELESGEFLARFTVGTPPDAVQINVSCELN